mmetsp:Transcript_6713/g.8228  ORF Transcript_6713/g.8228 Transcript_6713/m.8228 type:complete len:239 (-) Transcript_6713:803-1519(-)
MGFSMGCVPHGRSFDSSTSALVLHHQLYLHRSVFEYSDCQYSSSKSEERYCGIQRPLHHDGRGARGGGRREWMEIDSCRCVPSTFAVSDAAMCVCGKWRAACHGDICFHNFWCVGIFKSCAPRIVPDGNTRVLHPLWFLCGIFFLKAVQEFAGTSMAAVHHGHGPLFSGCLLRNVHTLQHYSGLYEIFWLHTLFGYGPAGIHVVWRFRTVGVWRQLRGIQAGQYHLSYGHFLGLASNP